MADIRNRRMDDPEGLSSRVFVGNIPLDTERDTLKKKFEVHGNVSGVMVLKGFAFVQFEKEEDAKVAIEKEKGTEVGGKKIDVKQAKQQKNTPQMASNSSCEGQWDGGNSDVSTGGPQSFRGGGSYRGGGLTRGRGANGNFGGGSYGSNRGNFGGPSIRGNSNMGNFGGLGNQGGNSRFDQTNYSGYDEYEGYDETGEEEYNEMSEMERFNDRLNSDDMDMEQDGIGHGGNSHMDKMYGGFEGGRGRGNFGGRGRGSEGFRGGGWGDTSSFGGGSRGGWGRGGMSNVSDQNFGAGWGQDCAHGGGRGGNNNSGQMNNTKSFNSEKAKDVEIVCLLRPLRGYAENIENRLKNMGLSVDILFPNPDIPLGKVLGNIASRGVMYAICVGPENEQHLSLTLNVLQGQQQEHRNMPIDDAMSFISQNFANMVESNSGGTHSGVQGGHPGDIMKILGFLSDDRPLSIMEYDKMIKYLVQKRESTLKEEYGESIPAHLMHPPVGPQQDPASKAKQEELQNRVQKILNRSKMSQQGSSGLAPSLQAAIESLVKSGPNLLSTMASAGSQGTPTHKSSHQGFVSNMNSSNQSQAFQNNSSQGFPGYHSASGRGSQGSFGSY